MKWIAFKDQLPTEGELILYGNYRFVDTSLYYAKERKFQNAKLDYKNVTHWCYIDPPPVVEWGSEWTSKPESSEAS